jgi:hypothetical protein
MINIIKYFKILVFLFISKFCVMMGIKAKVAIEKRRIKNIKYGGS